MTTDAYDPIYDWIIQPIPEKLWHYTSLHGFMGIVSSNNIFATNVRYLNDHEEFIHAQSFVDEVISETPEVDENGWTARDAVKKFTEGLFAKGVLSIEAIEVYVASFSVAEDQLSQWRGYTKSSTGVSLGFNLQNIRPDPSVQSLAIFSQCIYDDRKKKELISFAIKRFVSKGSQLWKESSDKAHLSQLIEKTKQENPGLSTVEAGERVKGVQMVAIDEGINEMGFLLAKDLLHLGGLLKHAAFFEEQEWRIVLPMFSHSTPKVHPRRYRVNPTTLVPYMEFDLRQGGTIMPITDVILGPGSEPLNSIEAARSFLDSSGSKIRPRMSKAPFKPL